MSSNGSPGAVARRELPRTARTAWIFPRDTFAFAVPASPTEVDLRLQTRFRAMAEAPRAVRGELSGGHGRLWFPPTKHSLPELRFEVILAEGRTTLQGSIAVPVRDQVIAVVVGCAFLLGSALAMFRPHGRVPGVLAALVGGLALGGTRRVVVGHPYEGRVLLSLLTAAAFDDPWTPPPRETAATEEVHDHA